MKTLPLAFLVLLFSAILGASSQVNAQCEPGLDCNLNGSADSCDIANNTSNDCDGNGVPDECQIALLPSLDCNQDQILDACEGSLEDLLTVAAPAVDYGTSSDISGDRLAVGAPDGLSGGVLTGAVYMYRNIGSRWVQETTIVPPDSTAAARFGWSVAIDGDLLIVGSPGATGGSLSQSVGAAYIYRHDGTNWIFEVKLEASNGENNDEFGTSVGVSGDRVVVGAWRALTGILPGSAYVFSHDGFSWNQDQIIESNDATPAKRFGGAVSIEGNTIAISDQRSDLGFLQQVGGVFIYTSISQTSWMFTQKITAQDPQEGAQFGRSIDLSSNQVLVGAPIADGQEGAAYLFERTGLVFNQSQKFSVPANTNGQMGIDVSISGENLIVGSWRAANSTGALYLMQSDGAGGYNTTSFTPANALEGDRFGWSVAAAGRWVLGTSSSTEFAVIDRLIDAPDCNSNGVDDPCDIFLATSQDCDLDGVPDACQIASGASSDCDLDGVPDHCEIASGVELDCNLNNVIDTCDIAGGTIQDCNINGIPDDCEADCNLNSIADECELSSGTATDCNGNGFLDSCDLQFGFVIDCNGNQIPDSCDIANGTEVDCNGNNALDVCEITSGIANDCNLNGLIDECELDAGLSADCNMNAVPDICDIAYGLSMDCNFDMTPDECELMTGAQQDCNQNGFIDVCELLSGSSFDCDSNNTPDECDLAGGALDCNGNAIPDSCEVNADPNPPVISGLPTEILITADLQGCSAVATWDSAVITDDCGISTSFTTFTSGSVFPVGSTAVMVSATDVSGNVSEHHFNVVVIDDQLPTISNLPTNISVDNDPGQCVALVTWAHPLTADNCLNVSLTSDHNPGDAFPVGTTLVTYTATDDSGNITQDSFEVSVQDVDLPSIVGLPGSVIVNSNPGVCTALVSWASPSIEDNCLGSTFTSDHQPGDQFPVGTTQINYTATDANGNSSAATFDLTVVDNELPTVSGIPSTVNLSNDPGSCGAVHSWAAPIVADNCGNPVMTTSHNSGDQFQIGSTTVSIGIDDGHGNTLDFTFDVNVSDTEMPVISGIPVSMTLSTSPGLCNQAVDWALPTVSDNCSGVTLVGSALAGTNFPVGDTEVIYTANDIHGNITQESFTISVIDDELPLLIGVPSSMTVDSLVDVCGSVVAWSEPSTSDNCGILQLSTSHAAGSTFDVGTTAVTYEVTDVNGNQAAQSFDVTVLDSQQPAIADLPQDIQLINEPGSCTAAASWSLPTASDNCSVSTLLSDRQSGEQFDVGTTTVTYTATDAAGLQTLASFVVIVEDTELPTIDGLVPSVSVTNIVGSCDALATWTPPTSTDNCGSPTLGSTHEPGWLFTVGDTVVTYTATDLHGNQTSAQIVISVLDDELPIISAAPVEIALSAEPGQCSATATWTEPTVTDNCEVQLVETTHSSATIFPVGTTLVTYTATDIHANSSQHSFSVIVTDMELPQILDLPATVEIPAELDMCSAMATWVAPTASDNCELLELVSSHAPGDIFLVGTTAVTLTATDVHNNSTTATFDVVVTDAQAPLLIQMPADIQLNSEAGLCSAVASWIDPSSEDNCGIEGLISSHVSGSAFDVGTTDVIFTLTDIHGNETQETMLVTVSDIEAPQITNLPERTTVETVAGTCEGTTSWIDPDTSDNCGIASLETDIPSGASLPVGETVVTYTVTDLSGNTSSQSFIVTVADQELPQLSGVPIDMVIPTDLGLCSATAPWTAPTAQDNCAIDTLVASHQPGEALPKGITEVSITATDIHGNVQTESFLVTVHDDEDPAIENMPLDITITAEVGLCGASVAWTAPTTSDNCDSVLLTSTHQPGEFFIVGTTEVTYTASDDDDNTSSASFLVTVTDDEAPALLDLSSDISLPAEAGLCSAAATWAAPATSDNCQVSTLTSTHNPGDIFVVGSTEVSYTVSDIHGNEFTASFLVTISDQQAPQFIGLPQRVTVPSEAGLCTAVVSWAAPTATDNCEVAAITLTHASGEQFPVGDTEVGLTATDIHGNDTLTSFIVTVEDLESPQILETPADIALANDAGSCGAIATWIDATSTDNCGIDTLTSSHSSGDFFVVGTTEVTITALDIHGNSSTSSYSVTITDSEDPTIASIPLDITLTAEADLCVAQVSWV
ncbi:MAG: HYR domain-containing protein, partial [Planctomycetota bacterium]|nr:HYR domain-containing protein [Planctomycetota bacterium]